MIILKVFKDSELSTEMEFHEDEIASAGRSDENRVVLKNNRVSREHFKIFFASDQWKLMDLNSRNGTRVNNKSVVETEIRDGDVIQVADFRIEVAVPVAESQSLGFLDNAERTVFTARPSPISDKGSEEMPAGGLRVNIQRFLKGLNRTAGGSKSIGSDETALKKRKMKIGIITLCLVFFIFIVILLHFQQPAKETTQEESIVTEEKKKGETIEDAELKRKVTRYMKSGRELFEKGDFSNALTRFQIVLDIDPGYQDAIEYANLCQEKLQETERIRQLQEEKERAVKERVSMLLNSAEEFYQKGEYAKSKELLSEARYLSPSDTEVERLFSKVGEKLKEENERLREESLKDEQLMAEIRKRYSMGQQYYEQGEYYLALKEWEGAISIGLPSKEIDSARRMIPEVKRRLDDKVKNDYDKAAQYYDNHEYIKALPLFEAVVKSNPEYKDAKERHEKLVELLGSRAKRLYQEGIVYEGIGQIEKANKKWNEVLEIMPLESNEYYQKARRKLGK
jgi:pSer/pThr/pTyr-binding forkhead associated (FHA) protein